MTLFSTAQFWWQKRSAGESLNSLADEQLIEKFAASAKPVYLQELMQRHNDALYHFLSGLSDPVLAEDTAQHAWLKLIEQPERYQKTDASFRTWLFSIGRNRLFDTLRQNNRWQWQPLEDVSEQDLPSDPGDFLVFDDEHVLEKFNQALDELSFSQREALMLQLEGFTVIEVASITNEKPETIKSRLRFARAQLKQRLEKTE